VLLLFFAQHLDLLKAVDELLFSVSDHLLQPLDIICTAIQHILHVSKQLFFICYEFPKLCGEDSFQNSRQTAKKKYSSEERACLGAPFSAPSAILGARRWTSQDYGDRS
jgi:hypothetical protein